MKTGLVVTALGLTGLILFNNAYNKAKKEEKDDAKMQKMMMGVAFSAMVAGFGIGLTAHPNFQVKGV